MLMHIACQSQRRIYSSLSTVYLGDFHRYHLSSRTWELVQSISSPAARFGHTLVLFDQKGYVFGGYDTYGFCCEEVHCYSFVTRTWCLLDSSQSRDLRATGGSLERFHHTAVSYARSMFVFGGKNGRELCSEDLLELHFDTLEWSVVSTIGLGPTRRYGHTATVVGSSMFVFGGRESGRRFPTDLYEYKFESRTWRKVEIRTPPASREFSSAWSYNGRLYIQGGQDGTGKPFNDLHVLDTLSVEQRLDSSSSLHSSGGSSRTGELPAKGKKKGKGSQIKPISSDSEPTRRMASSAGAAESSSAGLAKSAEWWEEEGERNKSRVLKLKCYNGDEIRILCIENSITYADFLLRLEVEYGEHGALAHSPDVISARLVSAPASVKVLYDDEDGDRITVRSEEDFEVMKGMARVALGEGKKSIFKIYLSIKQTAERSADLHRVTRHEGLVGHVEGRASSSSSTSLGLSPATFELPDMKSIAWKKGELLGRGAFGNVYLAMTSTGELLAVKEVNLTMSTKDEKQAVKALQTEISLLRQLRHPHIVRYLGSEVV